MPIAPNRPTRPAIAAARGTALCLGLALVLTGCGNRTGTWNLFQPGPAGEYLGEENFGDPTRMNIALHTGEVSYAEVLSERFAERVPTTINFAFNSAELDEAARAALREQARFIREFPEVRFSVYGHTDLVGSRAYNHRLGLRRARAAVNFLVSQGIDRSRLQALVSYGETRPLVATEMEDRRNRRTVTDVSGFVQSHPLVHNGRYHEIVYRAYVGSGGDG